MREPLNPHSNENNKNLKNTIKSQILLLTSGGVFKLWNLPMLWGWIPHLQILPDCFPTIFYSQLPSAYHYYYVLLFIEINNFVLNYMHKLLVHPTSYLSLPNNLLLLHSLFLLIVSYIFTLIFTLHSKLSGLWICNIHHVSPFRKNAFNIFPLASFMP